MVVKQGLKLRGVCYHNIMLQLNGASTSALAGKSFDYWSINILTVTAMSS